MFLLISQQNNTGSKAKKKPHRVLFIFHCLFYLSSDIDIYAQQFVQQSNNIYNIIICPFILLHTVSSRRGLYDVMLDI